MIAIPDLLILILLFWLITRRPKSFVVLWVVMFVIAILLICGTLFVAFYLRN